MGAGNGCLDRRVHTADAVLDTAGNVGVPERVWAEPVSAWTALLLSGLVFQHGQISGTSVEVHREDTRLIPQRRVFLMTVLLLFRPSFPGINSCLMPAFMWLGVWSLGLRAAAPRVLHFNGMQPSLRIYFGLHLNVLSPGKNKRAQLSSEHHGWSKSNTSGAGFPWQWRATPFMAFRGQLCTMCHTPPPFPPIWFLH